MTAYRASLQQSGEWQTTVVATEVLTVAPLTVGTRGTERRRESNDNLSDWDILITEFERDRVLGIMSTCGAIQIRERDLFTFSDDGSTKYTVQVEMTGSSLPTAAFHKRTVEELTRFRSRLEARA